MAKIKRMYRPNNVDFEVANEKYSGNEIGYAYAIYGVINGQYSHIHGMKEPYYTMIRFMSPWREVAMGEIGS